MDEGGNNKQQYLPNHFLSDDDDNGLSENVLLEVVSQDQYALSYTFFIIPELPSFELTGDLVDLLPEWLSDLCAHNGWKLEFVTVNPQYLQWALTVSTSIVVSQVVMHVRTELSKHILEKTNVPMDLKDSTDIWAHGYLLLHGLHKNLSEIIEQYIRLIREQQKNYPYKH